MLLTKPKQLWFDNHAFFFISFKGRVGCTWRCTTRSFYVAILLAFLIEVHFRRILHTKNG